MRIVFVWLEDFYRVLTSFAAHIGVMKRNGPAAQFVRDQ